MEQIFRKQYRVLTSVCDHTAKLAIPAIFSLFMDLATEHAGMLRLSADDLAQYGLYWLTVKTKVRIHRRPRLMEEVTAVSWPEKPGKISCNRYYMLQDAAGMLIEGKSEWAMIEIATGRLHRLVDAYPEDLVHAEDVVCDGPYARISEHFEECEELGVYQVRSTDIDLGQHMNNAAYLRVLFGAFSCEELAAMPIREVDINFRLPCFEGDLLTLRRRKTETGLEVGIFRPDGKAAATVRMLLSDD